MNKKSLELKGVCWQIGLHTSESIISKYLWIPNDEMPKKIWDDVKRVNWDIDNIHRDDELYYSYIKQNV